MPEAAWSATMRRIPTSRSSRDSAPSCSFRTDGRTRPVHPRPTIVVHEGQGALDQASSHVAKP
jgi:hypothetical protein